MLIWLTIQITQILFSVKINSVDSGLAVASGIEILFEVVALVVLISIIVSVAVHERIQKDD